MSWRERQADADAALDRLDDAVAARVHDAGWSRRPVAGRAGFVRPGGEVTAAAQLEIHRSHGPDPWPLEVAVTTGASHPPTLDLLPLLTLTGHDAVLLERPTEPPAVLHEAGRVPEAADVLAARILDPAVTAVVAGVPDVRALAESLRDQGPPEFWLALLLATGRAEEARTGLAEYLAGDDDVDGRFARQLGRRLDDPDMPVPPAAATDRLLQAVTGRRREATEPAERPEQGRFGALVKRAAADLPDGVDAGAWLTTQAAAAGLDLPPSELALAARLVELRRQRFGRVRADAAALRWLTRVPAALARSWSAFATSEGAVWQQLPERAGVHPRGSGGTWTAVAVSAAGARLLREAVASAPGRLLPYTTVAVWLSGDDVMVADLRVGHLAPATTDVLGPARAVAGLYDEDVALTGRVLLTDEVLLEVLLPAD